MTHYLRPLMSQILLVKCCLYPFVFIVAGIIAYLETNTYDEFTPVYLLLGIGAAIALTSLLRRITDENTGN